MLTVTEALRGFLASKASDNDLVRKVLEHFPALEVQVNVSAEGGEPVEGRRNTYTDGREEWWNIRVPKNANTEPTWADYPIGWNIARHVEGIGSTGWDWVNRRSLWVGFDFDSITSHASGSGVTESDLLRIRREAENLPYVETRRSTGGSGLHFYVYLDGIPTANHTEHAALARAILSMMTAAANFDFAAQVDVCGGNMWVWHRKITPKTTACSRYAHQRRCSVKRTCQSTGGTTLKSSLDNAPRCPPPWIEQQAPGGFRQADGRAPYDSRRLA